MDLLQIFSAIVVSTIAATGGYLASRASAKASMKNISTSSRVEMEKEAYERARALDTETIRRQDDEIDELREFLRTLNEDVKMVNKENHELHDENRKVLQDNAQLRAEVQALRLRVTRMQRGMHPDSTDRIVEREADTNPMMMREYSDGRE